MVHIEFFGYFDIRELFGELIDRLPMQRAPLPIQQPSSCKDESTCTERSNSQSSTSRALQIAKHFGRLLIFDIEAGQDKHAIYIESLINRLRLDLKATA
ncbi:hypothetical protein FQZ97_353190 [compost metagenome]